MPDAPAYVILGRGNWAHRMSAMLAGESRRVTTIEETRQRHDENEVAYVSRLADGMKQSAAQIAWLCVLPGPHVTLMIQAALESNLHVIVEKPWYGSPEDTARLQALAAARSRILAVHFEYLLLDEVEQWRRDHHPGTALRFHGHFFLNRPNRSGVLPLQNVGCHLAAIREYAVPSAEIAELQCAYERPDERRVWLEQSGNTIASIDLLAHKQPIIQRFIKKVEAAQTAAAFPFDLNFALRVAQALQACPTGA